MNSFLCADQSKRSSCLSLISQEVVAWDMGCMANFGLMSDLWCRANYRRGNEFPGAFRTCFHNRTPEQQQQKIHNKWLLAGWVGQQVKSSVNRLAQFTRCSATVKGKVAGCCSLRTTTLNECIILMFLSTRGGLYTDMKRQCLKLSISIRGRKLNFAIDAKEESVIEAKTPFIQKTQQRMQLDQTEWLCSLCNVILLCINFQTGNVRL